MCVPHIWNMLSVGHIALNLIFLRQLGKKKKKKGLPAALGNVKKSWDD